MLWSISLMPRYVVRNRRVRALDAFVNWYPQPEVPALLSPFR